MWLLVGVSTWKNATQLSRCIVWTNTVVSSSKIGRGIWSNCRTTDSMNTNGICMRLICLWRCNLLYITILDLIRLLLWILMCCIIIVRLSRIWNMGISWGLIVLCIRGREALWRMLCIFMLTRLKLLGMMLVMPCILLRLKRSGLGFMWRIVASWEVSLRSIMKSSRDDFEFILIYIIF